MKSTKGAETICLLCLTCLLFIPSTVCSQYAGIWKDTASSGSHNFFVQVYATGSMVVIHTRDAVSFQAFLGSLAGTTFQAHSVDPLTPAALRIVFASEDEATATLSDLPGESPDPLTLSIRKAYPALCTIHSGIWKDSTDTLNLYIQDYRTGSTAVLYTFDGVRFQAFLGTLPGVSFSEKNLADGTETLTFTVQGADRATAAVSPVSSSPTSISSGFSYSVQKRFPPPSLDVDFQGMPRSGAPPLSVAFTDLSTVLHTQWLWDFGDGGTSMEQNPAHTFRNPGTYSVSLYTTNGVIETFTLHASYITVQSISMTTPYVNAGDIAAINEAFSSDSGAPWGFAHDGIDFFPAADGTPFQAVFSGTVKTVDTLFNPRNGLWQVNLILEYDSTTWVDYAFEPWSSREEDAATQRNRILVSQGDTVPAGTPIATLYTVGSGAHVHFGLYQNGTAVCPEPYFSPEARQSILNLMHKDHPTWNMCY